MTPASDRAIRYERGDDVEIAMRNCLRLFAAAREAGVGRIVHVSVAGADPASPIPYGGVAGLPEPPLGTMRLSAWLAMHGRCLGQRYVDDLERHLGQAGRLTARRAT